MSGLQFPPLPSVPPEWPQLQLWWQQEATALSEKMDNIADMLSDDVLTPDKKSVWIMMYAFITGEQANVDAQATTLGITTEKTNYDSAITALTSYLATLTSLVAWNDLTDNTTIDGTTFRLKFNDVFVKKQTLLNKMADVNYSTANAAMSAITAITTDSILDKGEKQQLVMIVNNIINEKSGLDAQATTLGITTEKTTYDTAYTALVTTYLGGLSPAYADTTQNTTIVRSTFNTKFNDYYTAKTALVNKMADVAAAQSVVIDPFAEVKIYADSTGTVKSGQLPKTVAITASKNASAVTALGTWSRTVTSGITCTIGAATGLLNITALSVPSVKLPISFTYLGIVRTATVSIFRVDDPPTSSGTGGGTSSSTTTLGDTTGTAYDTTNAVSSVLTVTTGSVGQVACSAPVEFGRASGTGTTGAYGKWQWRVPAGVWADITTEVQETTTATSNALNPDLDTTGYLSVNHTKTGLAASTSYEFRFVWRRRDVSGGGANVGAYGGATMTATGS